MFRDSPDKTPQNKVINCILMNGGVGDHIGGSLIAIDYIIKTYPWMTLLVWTPDFLVDFAKNVLPRGTVVRGYSDMQRKGYDPERTTISTKWDGRVSPMKMHQTDYAFMVLCDEVVDIAKKNYLKVNFKNINVKRFRLPEKYVVFAVGYTAAVREFEPKTVNALTEYVISKGCTPVFIGQTATATGSKFVIEGKFSEEIDYSKGVSLINKTSLLEAAAVMQGAKAMVGVDCGLMHVAGCTDVPIVGGYTTVSPELRAPVRNSILGLNWYPVTPDESLGCRFCQVKTNFLYGHDYKNCLYDDRLCVSQLTPDKFIKHLEVIL